MVDENGDAARQAQRDYLRKLGNDPDTMSDEQFRAVTARHFVGTPDDVAADLQSASSTPGSRASSSTSCPTATGPGVVSMVGEMLHKLLG